MTSDARVIVRLKWVKRLRLARVQPGISPSVAGKFL